VYSAVFESKNGEKYVFGVNGGTVFDMDVGSGISVNIGTSQGFLQIGETVESQAVSGKPINVKGAIFRSIEEGKRKMRRVFAPFVFGRLVFDGKYYINAYVKQTPTFSPVKGDGRFSLQLFAPYPFFSSVDEKTVEIGSIEKKFLFPVNYSDPHMFGEKHREKYKNIFNAGDVKVPFKVSLTSSVMSKNPTLTNLHTLEFLKINGTVEAGNRVDIFRDDQGVLHAILKNENGEETDILSWVDESSTLFELNVGDNLIAISDENDENSLAVRFSYSPAVVSVYES
jgi:hypothetical protein